MVLFSLPLLITSFIGNGALQYTMRDASSAHSQTYASGPTQRWRRNKLHNYGIDFNIFCKSQSCKGCRVQSICALSSIARALFLATRFAAVRNTGFKIGCELEIIAEPFRSKLVCSSFARGDSSSILVSFDLMEFVGRSAAGDSFYLEHTPGDISYYGEFNQCCADVKL